MADGVQLTGIRMLDEQTKPLPIYFHSVGYYPRHGHALRPEGFGQHQIAVCTQGGGNFSVDGKEFEIRRVTRTFKKEYGITPMVYLNLYRISVAKFLLTTIRTSDEISTLTGFSDTSYFCSVFKKFEGCSPIEYRNKHNRE